jgi:uncharacterized membrane protein
VRTNVGTMERVASMAAGAGLLWLGGRLSRSGGLARLAAAGLLARGAAGYCLVNRALNDRRGSHNTRAALGGPRGVHVRERVTIRRPVDEVYRYWRDLTSLPEFMPHLDRVERIGDGKTHWVAKGPAGLRMSWDAEIINDRENQLIAWRSVAGGDVVMAGSVNFRPAWNGGTKLYVNLRYSTPAGRPGTWLARLLGSDPASQIRRDLRTLKHQLEARESRPVGFQ